MKTKFLSIILFLFLGLLISENIFAQDSTETKKHHWKWDWEFDEFDEWFNFKMPSITVGYGLSDIEHKNITDPFSDVNLIDLKLGHTSRKPRSRMDSSPTQTASRHDRPWGLTGPPLEPVRPLESLS